MNINSDAREFSVRVFDSFFDWDYEDEEKVFAIAQELELDADTVAESLKEAFGIKVNSCQPWAVPFVEIFNRYLALLAEDILNSQIENSKNNELNNAYLHMLKNVYIDADNIVYHLDDETSFWKAWKNATEEQRNDIEHNKILKYFKDFIDSDESDA